MKREKDMVVGWGEFIKEIPKIDKSKYSTAEEITKKTGMCIASARAKLKALREKGLINAIQGISEQGQKTWYYKD